LCPFKTTGRPLIIDKAGLWNKTLTTQERDDWVAANKEVPYVQFTYDASNYTAGYNTPDGGPYRLVITNGTCQTMINELTRYVLQDVDLTLYFKSQLTVGSDDGASLFMLSTGSSIYDNKGLLTMYRANAAATSMNFVIGSNLVNYKESVLTGFPGYNHYTHVFLMIKSTDELVAYVYDDTEALIHTSTTTIDSSVFGDDYDRNMLNGRPVAASGNGRRNTTKDCGWWQKVQSVSEMEAVVAANPN
jgi:hypothetical protein